MTRTLGYSPAELIGKPVADFTYPDDSGRRAQFMRDLIEGRIVSGEQERRFVHRNGSVVWTLINASAQRDQSGKPLYVISLVQDITARKQAEEAIRESEKKYRSLVENINDVLFTVDIQGLFTYVSPVIEGIAGYTPEEMIGQSFSRFIFQDDLPMLIERFYMVLAGEIGPAEYRIVTKTGDVRWVRSSSRPVIADGKTVAIQGLIRDITQRKLAEEKLARFSQRNELILLSAAEGILVWICRATTHSSTRPRQRCWATKPKSL